jgi:hypothetical protein
MPTATSAQRRAIPFFGMHGAFFCFPEETMKKTTFSILLTLITLLILAMPALAQGTAQADPPAAPLPQAVIFPTPEVSAWANHLAARGGWLLLVIGLDMALGITSAIRQKKFKWQRTADILSTYGTKILGWLALELLGLMPVNLQAIGGLMDSAGMFAYGILLLASVGSVLGHVSALGLLPVEVPGIKMQTTKG